MISLFCLGVVWLAPHRSWAEPIKIGAIRAASPILVAQDKGYFSAEGIAAEIVFFDSAPPIASAVVSGDIDFASTGLSAALYNLAAGGALRIIAAASHEAPGFHNITYAASAAAYAGGLESVKQLPGHSVAITQFGAPVHYSLALAADKYGFALDSIRIVPLPSNPAQVAAIRGGSVDAALIPAAYVLPEIKEGRVRLVGYVGDETPWQSGGVFVSRRTADERADLVRRFLRAYHKAAHDYHDAFTDSSERRIDGPTSAELVSIFANALQQPAALVGEALQYVDADARLDVDDVRHQVAWYRAKGFVHADVSVDELIDSRYAIPLAKLASPEPSR
jgi:NitT/TauT family transport system substrate-binding protein